MCSADGVYALAVRAWSTSADGVSDRTLGWRVWTDLGGVGGPGSNVAQLSGAASITLALRPSDRVRVLLADYPAVTVEQATELSVARLA